MNSNSGTYSCQWGVLVPDRCHLNVDTEQCPGSPGAGSPEDNWCSAFSEEDCEERSNACQANASICWKPDDFNFGNCTQIPRNPNGTCPEGSWEDQITCQQRIEPTSSVATPTPLPITPLVTRPPAPPYPTFSPCEFAADGEKGQCNSCLKKPGVYTAIGCIPTSPGAFVTNILVFAMGMAGGLAFLIMLYGAFVIITAGGNPEKVAGGQQTITAAVMGLLTIMFAAVILNIIGIQIIQIPGF